MYSTMKANGAALLLAAAVALSPSLPVQAQDDVGDNIFLPMVTNGQYGNEVRPNNSVPSIPNIEASISPDETLPEELLDESTTIYDMDENSPPLEKVNAARIDNACPEGFVVGREDLTDWAYRSFRLPACITDFDGGTIRLIMQHETNKYDQVRMIDLHIGTEFIDNSYGNRGRWQGRAGWTRQSGGGDYGWVLGDWQKEIIAGPWGWVWILDHRIGSRHPTPGDGLHFYSVPDVTARVIFKD